MGNRTKEWLDAYYRAIDEIDFFDTDKDAFGAGVKFADENPYLHWINAFKQTPKYSQEVLMYTKTGLILHGMYRIDSEESLGFYQKVDAPIEYVVCKDITHWLPMINTPNEE